MLVSSWPSTSLFIHHLKEKINNLDFWRSSASTWTTSSAATTRRTSTPRSCWRTSRASSTSGNGWRPMTRTSWSTAVPKSPRWVTTIGRSTTTSIPDQAETDHLPKGETRLQQGGDWQREDSPTWTDRWTSMASCATKSTPTMDGVDTGWTSYQGHNGNSGCSKPMPQVCKTELRRWTGVQAHRPQGGYHFCCLLWCILCIKRWSLKPRRLLPHHGPPRCDYRRWGSLQCHRLEELEASQSFQINPCSRELQVRHQTHSSLQRRFGVWFGAHGFPWMTSRRLSCPTSQSWLWTPRPSSTSWRKRRSKLEAQPTRGQQ